MSILTLNQAHAYLAALQMPSIEEALHYLEGQVERRYFLKLFEELFPQEARAAFARAIKRRPEVRLFELIEQRLFPLCADMCIEALNSGELPSAMPLYTVNQYLDDWMVDGCTENWGLAERVARFLAAGFDDERDVLREVGWESDLAPINWRQWTCDLQMFQELCTAVDPEIREAVRIIFLIQGDTGNFWLDTCSESISYYLWDFSKENVLELTREYQAAKAILEQATHVIEYLNARPRLLKQLINCWRLSLRPAPAETKVKETGDVA